MLDCSNPTLANSKIDHMKKKISDQLEITRLLDLKSKQTSRRENFQQKERQFQELNIHMHKLYSEYQKAADFHMGDHSYSLIKSFYGKKNINLGDNFAIHSLIK
jgi:hypothetical protein